MQRTDHEEHQPEDYPTPNRIMLRNEVGQQPEHRCIDQREQPADEPEADTGILQPQQQQKCCNADHKAQRRMNCGKLIGNAEKVDLFRYLITRRREMNYSKQLLQFQIGADRRLGKENSEVWQTAHFL